MFTITQKRMYQSTKAEQQQKFVYNFLCKHVSLMSKN